MFEELKEEEVPKEWKYLLEYVPNLAYWKVHSDIKDPANFCGHIQRAFVLYWAVLMHKKTGGVGLDIGGGQIDAKTFWSKNVDYYSGESHPAYGGAYHPDIVASGESLPFENNSYDWIVSNHAIEHMDAKKAFHEWLRVLKPDGIIAFVTPDGKYGPIPDPDGHVKEWTPDEFFVEILLPLISNDNKIELIEIDTFKNSFSWNCVVRKK